VTGDDILSLREVRESDIPTFFEQVRDAVANRMAAFTAQEPNDRGAFDKKWRGILVDESVVMRTILVDDEIVGHIGRFEWQGAPQVTYWVDRRFWGKGIASRALARFLQEWTERPLFASAASDNAGSLRVLQKCGFVIRGTEQAYANGRGEIIDETMLELR
jgi:RimJ/RimL family protein N-acetyltransferase